jgi:putative transposase
MVEMDCLAIDLRPIGGQAMTVVKLKTKQPSAKALIAGERDLMKALLKEALDEVLDAEMTELLGAGRSELTQERTGYRAGYYSRGLITRIGKLELRVPRDRHGEFSTVLFERYQRSEKALVSALAEMYVQGVSTRKVKAITEELCGHRFCASTISAINKGLDEASQRIAIFSAAKASLMATARSLRTLAHSATQFVQTRNSNPSESGPS